MPSGTLVTPAQVGIVIAPPDASGFQAVTIPNTAQAFAYEVLQRAGLPTTAQNIQLIAQWIAREGGGRVNNPLNTTQKAPGSYTTGTQPKNGPQNYPDLETGITATVATLQNGDYPDIVAALESGDATQADGAGTLSRGLLKWSGGAYATVRDETANLTAIVGTGIEGDPGQAIPEGIIGEIGDGPNLGNIPGDIVGALLPSWLKGIPWGQVFKVTLGASLVLIGTLILIEGNKTVQTSEVAA